MKMKYHKIRGVDLSTCTAEQKLAYNIAFSIYGDPRYNWSANASRAAIDAAEQKAIADYLTIWTRDHASAAAKYNTDAIFCALRAGLHDYLFGSYHIFCGYAQIGKAFPAHYL